MVNDPKHLLEFGPFRVDPEQRVLLRDQHPIPLSPKAFDLLLALLERSGQVVLKDDLMKLLWPDTFVEESNLGQHIFLLRKALGERAHGSSYIVTVPGRGYRFAQRVCVLPREEDEDIVVESHSRARVLIEGTVPAVGGDIPYLGLLDSDRLRALPAPPHTRWHWHRIVTLIILATIFGTVVIWLYLRPMPMPKVVRLARLTSNGRAEPYGPALGDGARVFFAERFGGKGELAQVSESGGEPGLVSTSIGGIELYDIDRHRGRLLVASQGRTDAPYPLWIVPTTGGSARRVGGIVTRDATWSPDGQQIAYVLRTELFVVDDEGMNPPNRLFVAPGAVEHPRWSPDGQLISFTVRSTSGSTTLWEIHSDGSDPHAFSFGWKAPPDEWEAGECCADWSPSGRYFLFRSIRDGVESLWLAERSKGWFHSRKPVQLYTGPGHIDFPRFSPDGSKIFYVNYDERRELVRYDSAKRLFVPYLGGIQARTVNFSRDGQWVAYTNPLDNTLWRSRIDGTQKLQLTFPPMYVLHPTWSPDGAKIAFEGSGRLYTIPLSGGKPEALLAGGTGDAQPNWSPDGKFLAFARWTPRESIGLLNLNTRQVEFLPDSESTECPQWSPDGKYLAASNNKSEKLVLFDLEHRRWSDLADGTPYGWGLRWSSDSKYVYYQHYLVSEEQAIFRVRVSDRRAEQITSLREILRADVLSFSMTGLTPDNSPLASLSRTDSDVLALELSAP